MDYSRLVFFCLVLFFLLSMLFFASAAVAAVLWSTATPVQAAPAGVALPFQIYQIIQLAQGDKFFDWCAGCYTTPAVADTLQVGRGGLTQSSTLMVMPIDPASGTFALLGSEWKMLCRAASAQVGNGFFVQFEGYMDDPTDVSDCCTWTYTGPGQIMSDNGMFLGQGTHDPTTMKTWQPSYNPAMVLPQGPATKLSIYKVSIGATIGATTYT